MSTLVFKEALMNKDELSGKVDNLTGRGKEAVGAVTGDKETQAEGFGQRVKGAVQEKIGQAKEKIEEAKEKIAERKRDSATGVEESDDD